MLAQLKQIYFSKRLEEGKQSFEMSDIVPLVRRAWEKSFANQINAKKAIAERGWGPLNYICIDHPDVRKEIINKDLENVSTSNSNHSGNIVIDTSTFNYETGYAGSITESIVALHLKDEKRKQTLLEKKTKINLISNNTEKIKALCKSIPSSGILGGIGHFSFSENLSEVIREENKRKHESEELKINRKKVKLNNDVVKYLSARTKYNSNNVLTVAEYKSLIKYHKRRMNQT